jgi:hypothetical protein
MKQSTDRKLHKLAVEVEDKRKSILPPRNFDKMKAEISN